MRPLRIWLVGFGMVGRWLADVLESQRPRLADRFGAGLTVVGIASARNGFVYDGSGLDLRSARKAAQTGRPLADQPGVRHWPAAIDGLRVRPVGQVAIIGPGAGPELAGQGVLSDLIAVARRRAGGAPR